MGEVITTLNEDGSIAWSEYRGEIVRQDILDNVALRYGNPERRAALRYVVADYRQASMNKLTAADIRCIAEITTKLALESQHITMIGIIVGDLKYGLSRMFDGWAKDLPWTRHLVADEVQARALLASLIKAAG